MSQANGQSDETKDGSKWRRRSDVGFRKGFRDGRTRSIYAQPPSTSFGPKACLKKVPQSQIMQVTDPSSQRLQWKTSPLTVLIIKKIMDVTVLPPFIEMATWLIQEKNLVIYVQANVLEDQDLLDHIGYDVIKGKLKTFKECDELSDKIDFIICLGGDGTLLYASSLFQEGSIPPVMAFNLGSLGFLTPFDFQEFKESIESLLQGQVAVTLRSRLKCLVLDSFESNTNGLHQERKLEATKEKDKKKADPNNMRFKCQVLNEAVIDRGPSPYLSNLDLYLDGRIVTTVQGDGLIISTPTGSTAYAAAAGATMLHPNVPAILVTPICPHTLSFRPIVVPAGVELKVVVPEDARHTAWVALDGKNRQELQKGWCVRITTSVFPVASVCRTDQVTDWFDSLVECMHWNTRQRQKDFKREVSNPIQVLVVSQAAKQSDISRLYVPSSLFPLQQSKTYASGRSPVKH
ncbi:NAD kinase-like isoform X2 [Amphiura filiformis]|uniref:NAD kinase-like isoform X2 n=1 Tax=Amphiura filiformis TaxID=82378 RepID=UPI003B21670C